VQVVHKAYLTLNAAEMYRAPSLDWKDAIPRNGWV